MLVVNMRALSPAKTNEIKTFVNKEVVDNNKTVSLINSQLSKIDELLSIESLSRQNYDNADDS